ncbi:MAG: hypothetical protein AB1716_12595 [Planctomycetota bacterium]
MRSKSLVLASVALLALPLTPLVSGQHGFSPVAPICSRSAWAAAESPPSCGPPPAAAAAVVADWRDAIVLDASGNTVFGADTLNYAAPYNYFQTIETRSPGNRTCIAQMSFGGFTSGLDFHADGRLYGYMMPLAGWPNGDLLYSIDTGTGQMTYIGIGDVGGTSVTGMTYNRVDRKMYICDWTNSERGIRTIDVTNARTSPRVIVSYVSGGSGSPWLIGIAAHPTTGKIYGLDIGGDRICEIDPGTGQARGIGALNTPGYDWQYGQGLEFDDSDGTLYAAPMGEPSSSGLSGHWGTIDLNTGNYSDIGRIVYCTYRPLGVAQFSGFAIEPSFAIGDLNCDGAVDFDDINPFVLALSDPAGYAVAYPNCNILNGDVNGDGQVNFDDINPFVALLTNP